MIRNRSWYALVLTTALGLTLAGCGGGDSVESIAIDGSSTVAPLSEKAAEDFMTENQDVQVTVGTSGTGGGFEKFCNGETDISDASRSIEEDEAAACSENGIEYEELQVANDGLTVVVNPENDWAECLTVEQLETIWEPAAEGEITNWNQVDPSFPDEELELFGAGTDSGTFDYFTAAINGEEGASRTDYQATEDDNVTVQGVSGTTGGLGYFGLSYYEENKDVLKAVEIDGGDGCIAPSQETVQSGEYTPLSRPLFIYVTKELVSRPEGIAFVEFYEDNIDSIAEEVLFVPLTDAQKADVAAKIASLKA
jgi:phosphate transport system substrate-binding protein